jgi:hypothetical protein
MVTLWKKKSAAEIYFHVTSNQHCKICRPCNHTALGSRLVRRSHSGSAYWSNITPILLENDRIVSYMFPLQRLIVEHTVVIFKSAVF